MKFRLFFLLSVLAIIIGCNSCQVESTRIDSDLIEENYSEKNLKIILSNYINHLKDQKIDGVESLKVILKFNAIDSNILTIYSSRYEPSFENSKFCFFAKTEYDSLEIFFVENASTPVDKRLFSDFGDSLESLDCHYSSGLLIPPFTNPVFKESVWDYSIEKDHFILKDKHE